MDIWESTVLTDKGVALQAKLIDGQSLSITKAMTGAAKVPIVNLRQQTSVTDGGTMITLQPVRVEGNRMVVPLLLENMALEESYNLWQVGIYAQDPEEGEILYCLAQASEAKHIPSASDSPGFSITWDFYFKTSNTSPFEVDLDSNGLVSIEQYQIHTGEINNLKSSVKSLSEDLQRDHLEGAGIVKGWEDKTNVFLKRFIINRTGIYLITLYVRFCGAVNITKVGASINARITINEKEVLFAQRNRVNIPVSKTWDQPNSATLPIEFKEGDSVQINFENETGIKSDAVYDTYIGYEALYISR